MNRSAGWVGLSTRCTLEVCREVREQNDGRSSAMAPVCCVVAIALDYPHFHDRVRRAPRGHKAVSYGSYASSRIYHVSSVRLSSPTSNGSPRVLGRRELRKRFRTRPERGPQQVEALSPDTIRICPSWFLDIEIVDLKPLFALMFLYGETNAHNA